LDTPRRDDLGEMPETDLRTVGGMDSRANVPVGCRSMFTGAVEH
jgi:hypothetical protein